MIAGETRGPATVTKDYIAHLARLAIRDIGYEQAGFHWEDADIEVLLHAQSADIAQASTRPATRTRAPATRASCSATPAARRRS